MSPTLPTLFKFVFFNVLNNVIYGFKTFHVTRILQLESRKIFQFFVEFQIVKIQTKFFIYIYI
jgi:hypothetical protein